ncbi:MAG: CapA family protein [Alistipes sp.]|nr:CapA family protein [Alistipes sp.]
MNIVFGGDFAPSKILEDKFAAGEFDAVLGPIRPCFESADFNIVNFETTILPPAGASPIAKEGPNLRNGSCAAEALKWLGITGVTMANNHVMDYGAAALNNTVEVLDEKNISYVGVGANLEAAARPLLLEKDGLKVAVVNCCEQEFSIATRTSPGANPLDPVAVYYQIRQAKQEADKVIVVVHGGHERFNLPSLRMKRTYRFFVDAGADAVINHHQHCYSGYEVYREAPIFYGVGNFCFDKPHEKTERFWHEGYLVGLNLSGAGVSFVLMPYIQCLGDSVVAPMKDTDGFFGNIRRLNEIIASDELLQAEVEKNYDLYRELMLGVFEPKTNFLSKVLYKLKFLSSAFKTRKKYRIANYINCESHLDRLRYSVNKTL